MKKHVLVMALSAFSQKDSYVKKTKYVFNDKSTESGFYYEGHLQQEVIPVFIKNKMEEEITDFVLLTTSAVENTEKSLIFEPDTKESFRGTVLGYNIDFLTALFPTANIHTVHYDELGDTSMLFDVVMKKIQELHGMVDKESEWKLWFDTHGGFRDVSLALISSSRLMAMDNATHIATDAIFSVLHFWEPDRADVIVDQTAFYFSESTEALKNYLLYGQYLKVQFNAVNEKPYAFISYSHRSDNEKYLLSIRMIFQNLKNKGIRFWFDDGINTGDDWVDVLKKMNDESDLFIGIFTNEYFSRPECWKELIRSVNNKKPAHFFLIGSVDVRTSVPDEFTEVKQLQEELQVTDEQIKQYIAPFLQVANEAKVLPGNANSFINERLPEDPDFLKEFDVIESKIKNNQI